MKFTINKPKLVDWHSQSGAIKLKKIEVGSLSYEKPHVIRLQFKKIDQAKSENPNCPWYWIKIKQTFDSLEDAKEYLNSNLEYFKDKVWMEN